MGTVGVLEWVREEASPTPEPAGEGPFRESLPAAENDLWGRLGPGEFLCQLTMDGAKQAQRLVADLRAAGFEAAYLPYVRHLPYGYIHDTPWFGYQILDHLAEQPWHIPRNEIMEHEPLIVFVRPGDLQGVEAFMRERWQRHQPSPTDQPLDFATDTCPACGAPLPDEARECPDCGLCF